MKIELKNVKIHRAMSEETTAFNADLWVNDVKVGSASNRGHGGCNDVTLGMGQDIALLAQMRDHCKALPPVVTDYGPLDMDLDFFISRLVEREEVVNTVRRGMKTKVYLLNAKGQMCNTRKLTPAQIAAFKPGPGEVVQTEEQVIDFMLK